MFAAANSSGVCSGVGGWLKLLPSYNQPIPTCEGPGTATPVTGQRLSDICKMQFSDIWDDMLHVQQEKTGSRLAIPLDLKCEALNMTLRDVISKCRDAVVSKYLVHFRHSTSQSVRGGNVSSSSLTTTFKKARGKCGIEWEKGTAPTFHEQRSLSERLYREQGIDTQKLLGHKSRKMTDKYNDDRGKEWVVIDSKTG
ncbi:TPA: tyrosine-type recombinase/integrase [Kluyvera ascorbata]|nr:tyrosine-type recombinase/integrase [Kluyvera ascorbata]